jgi:hypothetical protein
VKTSPRSSARSRKTRGTRPAVSIKTGFSPHGRTHGRLCRRTPPAGSRIVGKSSTVAKPRVFARGTSGSGCHSSLACQSTRQNSAAGRTRYTGDAARAWHRCPDSRASLWVSFALLETIPARAREHPAVDRATAESGIVDASAATPANGDAPLSRDRAAPPAQR